MKTGGCSQLALLSTLDGYRELFANAEFWAPYVRAVCAQHGLAPCTDVRAPTPGTCPTFSVDERWVVKFFGRLFDGGRSWAVERAVAGLLEADRSIPSAPLLAEGYLCDEDGTSWPWPYVIFKYVPGVSFGEVYAQAGREQKLALAREMGRLARRLHALAAPPGSRSFWLAGGRAAGGHAAYTEFLRGQREGCLTRQEAWASLPSHLLIQLEDFLPPVEEFLPSASRLHLIHADLTGDHVLGQLEADQWETRAIIDFGDAMLGDLYYELVALHLDLFRGDKAMLGAFLEKYGLPAGERRGFAHRAMAYTLLHRFDVLAGVLTWQPALGQVGSLSELAGRLWDIDS
jgi:hypothetical protein